MGPPVQFCFLSFSLIGLTSSKIFLILACASGEPNKHTCFNLHSSRGTWCLNKTRNIKTLDLIGTQTTGDQRKKTTKWLEAWMDSWHQG